MKTKVFISWSGTRSHAYAKALRSWIPNVLQQTRCYLSSKDIQPGERWLKSIEDALRNAEFSIVCLTPENLKAEWIHFEAGAVWNSLEKSRVVPVLCGASTSQLSEPLQPFQAVTFSEEGILSILLSLNSVIKEELRLTAEEVQANFEKWWPDLLKEIETVHSTRGAVPVWDGKYDVPAALVIYEHGPLNGNNIPFRQLEVTTIRSLINGDYEYKQTGTSSNIIDKGEVKSHPTNGEMAIIAPSARNTIIRFHGMKAYDQEVIVQETSRTLRIPAQRKLQVDDKLREILFQKILPGGWYDYAGRRTYCPIGRFRLLIYFQDNYHPREVKAVKIGPDGAVDKSGIISSKGKSVEDGRILFVVEGEGLPADSGMWAYYKWPPLPISRSK